MKKSTLYFIYVFVSICFLAYGTLQAQEDDGIYSVSGQKKEKKKKKKDIEKNDSLYFIENENADNKLKEADNTSDGYKQVTTSETGEDYAKKSSYDNYTVSEAYNRNRTSNYYTAPANSGFRITTGFGMSSMYGNNWGSNPYYSFNNSLFYDPYYNPYNMYSPYAGMSMGFYSGFYSGFYYPYGYYPYGYGMGYYSIYNNGFYNPYGVYNPYYMHCPPYQSGFYGDNNLYTGPRPAVSGGSITTGGDVSTNRPGGIRIGDTYESDINKYQPTKGSVSDIKPSGGITRVQDNNYNSVIERNPNTTEIAPQTDTRDSFRLPKSDQSSRKNGNALFRWSGGADTPSNSDSNFDNNRDQRSPFGNSGTRTNDRPSYNSPSRSGSSPSYNSTPRPSSPTPSGGGSRSSGGSIRR
jgi:hypothetical protein